MATKAQIHRAQKKREKLNRKAKAKRKAHNRAKNSGKRRSLHEASVTPLDLMRIMAAARDMRKAA